MYPGALLSHRTALNPSTNRIFNPYFGKTGAVYLTYSYRDRVEWPGVTVFLLNGPRALATDVEFDETLPGLQASSVARALLENMQTSRRTVKGPKTVGRAQIMNWMHSELLRIGVEPIERLRVEAERVARELGMERELGGLEGVIAAVLKGRGRRILGVNRVITRMLA